MSIKALLKVMTGAIHRVLTMITKNKNERNVTEASASVCLSLATAGRSYVLTSAPFLHLNTPSCLINLSFVASFVSLIMIKFLDYFYTHIPRTLMSQLITYPEP